MMLPFVAKTCDTASCCFAHFVVNHVRKDAQFGLVSLAEKHQPGKAQWRQLYDV